MNVLVDTSVWSLAFRRRRASAPEVAELAGLLADDRAVLLGAVRQEVLSAIPDAADFRTLRDRLRGLPDYPLSVSHYEVASESFNTCRSRGVQGSYADFLLCAVSLLDRLPLFTTDRDFDLFARHLPVTLYVPGP